MLNKKVKRMLLSLGMSLAIVSLATGCSKLKKPQETETETETATETESETEAVSETEEQTELQTEIPYKSQDRSIQITLPDSTWKVTSDVDENRVFQSGSAAMINIAHASDETQMKRISVAESKEALTESLTKQYTNEGAFEVVDFKTSGNDVLNTYEYVVKYNSTAMWTYSITYGIIADNEAYVIQGTVTDDNKVLLDAVKKSVESFTVLRNSVFSAVKNGTVEQTQSESNQTQSETNQGADAELSTLTEYGTTAILYSNDNVNIRLDPSTESDENIIGSLEKGDEVTVIGETAQWFKVNINGNIGYVSKAFLVKNKPAEDTQTQETERKPADSATQESAELNSRIDYESATTLYAAGDAVNVRTQPGTNSDVIDVRSSGQALQVVGETDNWYIVSINGTVGYVSKSYVSATNDGGSSGSTGGGNSDSEDMDGGSSDDGNGFPTSGTGTISGTVTGASMNGITIAGDDGNTYIVNTTDANVSTEDGLYQGLYVSVSVDYSNTTPSGELYATSVTGY